MRGGNGGAGGGLSGAAGLVTSPDFTVEADGVPIWTEHFEFRTFPEMPDYLKRSPYIGAAQRIAIANFAVGGPVSLTIMTKQEINSCTVRPKSKAIPVKREGARVTLQLPGPQKLYVEIDHLPPLLVFANAVEKTRPAAGDPHVRYFGPGEHVVGDMHPKDGETIHIAGGAIVYGRVDGEGCKNVRIFGHGILENSRGTADKCVLLKNAGNVTVEGIVTRNTKPGWSCVPRDSRGITFRDVKVLSFGETGDGIGFANTSDGLADNCFLRCVDDCITVKQIRPGKTQERVTVKDSTMFGFAVSDGFTIGFEEMGPVRDVKVINCDILAARGGGKTGGHSAFSIVCDGPGPVSDVLFENIRVEDQIDVKNFELIVTDGQRYVKMPPGNIRNVMVRNVHWERGDRKFVLKGLDAEHTVQGVTFEGCTVAGKPLASLADAKFDTNPFAQGIHFSPKRWTGPFKLQSRNRQSTNPSIPLWRATMIRYVIVFAVSLVASMGLAAENPEHFWDPNYVVSEATARAIEEAMPDKPIVPPGRPRKLLVYGRVPTHPGSVACCFKAIEAMGKKTGAFEAVASGDPLVFLPENLKQFDAVLMNNTHEQHPMLPLDFKTLTDEQKAAASQREAMLQKSLLNFVAGGKGIVGIHGAVATSWAEYLEMMGGSYGGHFMGPVWVKPEDPAHPLCAPLEPQGFQLFDEIYVAKERDFRKVVRVLLSLDLRKMPDPGKRADGDYVISWVRPYGKGRVFYCSLGHEPSSYCDPRVLRHYLAGIQFALGDLEADATPR